MKKDQIIFKNNHETLIECPECQAKLLIKTNNLTGHQFLGCPNYPDCRHTQRIPQEWKLRAQGQPELFSEGGL